MSETHSLKQLVMKMLKIGIIGFGGGTALIPVIDKELSGYISEEDYNKDVLVASITPGALPVEIAAGIGRQIAGIPGMIASASAMAFPGSILTLLFLILASRMDDTARASLRLFSFVVTLFIIYLLIRYIISTVRQTKTKRERTLFLILMLIIFLLCGQENIYQLLRLEGTPLFSFSTVEILAVTFPAIALLSLCTHRRQASDKKRKEKGGRANPLRHFPLKKIGAVIGSWLVFLLVLSIPAYLYTGKTVIFLVRGFISSLLSFGGGDAYLSVAQGLFVDSGLVSSSRFYGSIVPIANALPGSILCKVLTGIGYTIGYQLEGSVFQGICMALCGFACSAASSGSIFTSVYIIYEEYEYLSFFAVIKRFIRPVISGLLINVALSLLLLLQI